MAQLQRIILIHTHLPGVVELNIDGHANICGTNASGKTTLQRLIPVFYGEQPNRVVPRTRKKFDEFYLPYDNSYLVYEYTNGHDQMCQVVLTRKSDGGVEYRFVPAPYAPEQLLVESKKGAQGVSQADWLLRLQEANVKPSQKITATSEYRAIIQNDVSMMRGQNRDNLRMRQNAARFGLCKSPQNLRHIEKLVSAVHAKEGKMDTLRTMLATILEEEGNHRPTQPMKAAKIRHWLQQMRLYHGLETLEKQYTDVGHWVKETQQSLATLWQLKPLLEKDAMTLKQRLADTSEELAKLEDQRRAEKAQYDEQRDALRDRKISVEKSHAFTTQWLDRNQAQYDTYVDQDFARIARDYEALPILREQLLETSESYQVLLEAHSSQRQAIDQQKLKLRESLDRVLKRNQEKLRTVEAEQRRARETFEAEQDHRKQSFEAEQQALSERFQQELNALHEQYTRLKIAAEQQGFTADEQAQLSQVEHRIESAQSHLDSALDILETARVEVQKAMQTQTQADDSLTSVRKEFHRLEQQEQQLLKLLQPDERSLRFFLNSHVENWQETLGKVIAEPLLARTDLQPTLAEKSSSIFGVNLDTSALEVQSFAAAEAEIKAELERVMAERKSAAQEVKANEQILAKAHDTYKEKQTLQAQAQQQVRKLEQERGYAKEAKQRLMQNLEQGLRERSDQAKSEALKLEKKLAKVKVANAEELKIRKHEFESQLLELKADAQERFAEFDEKRSQLEQQVNEKRAQVEEQVQALEVEFDETLAAQGIDKAKLTHLKAEKERLEGSIRELELQQDALHQYRRFMSEEYSVQRPEMLEQERNEQQELRSVERELEALESHWRTVQTEIEGKSGKHRETQKQAQVALTSVSPFIDQLEQLPVAEYPAEATFAATDIDERIQRCSEALAHRKKAEGRLKTQLEQFESALRKDATPDFLETMEQQLGYRDGLTLPQDTYQTLGGLMTLLQDRQSQVVEQGLTIGNALLNFFSIFDDINKRVGHFSKRLSEVVSDDLSLDEIEKSEVRITSTIDELGFWEPLKKCAKHIVRWRESGESLPSSEYMESLGEVAEMLRADQDYALESLLRIELHLREAGADLVIRNDRQLMESSSHGMAYLILCKFLLAFTRLLRGDADTQIHWPIDEIGTLAYHNVEKLFLACDKNQIHIVGAFPNPESDVLLLFKHRYLIEVNAEKPSERKLKRIEPRVSELTKRLQAARAEVSA
ncbi:MAG: protein of unknown function DUF3584 [Idiomarinaceae bacterium HL-53]|nr:MAG: protein of unknown function DUF3584 [Idiomarinaceae bacterium HL-53]CUS48101.1 Protein of unknown function (DUF3584) [Idiomarinaceae bacterium HL-53]